MIDYSDICKNIGDIPNYLLNDDLRKVINIGIHDAIRHSNNIGMNSKVIFNITVHEKIGTNRLIKCETFFNGNVPNIYTYDPVDGETNDIPNIENKNINYSIVRRTTVEPEKQNDIVSIDINIEE